MTLPQLAALLSWACLSGLSGCFKDNPVVQPGHVYDPSLEITRAHLEPYDSAIVKLVDKADSNRVILLWSGRADTLSRIPTYLAGADESFLYRIEGYKTGKGLCHAEELDQGRRVVLWDSCGKSAFRLLFTPAVLALEEDRPQAGLRIAGSDTLGAPVSLAAPEWLTLETSTFRFADAGTTHAVGYRVRWELLPPGRTVQGWIRCSSGAGDVDSLAVVVRRNPVDWLGLDSLDLGPFAVETTISVTVPFRAGPEWLKAPAVPWLTVVPIGGELGGPQGARRGLRIIVARDRLPAVPRSAASLLAYGDSGQVVDSLVVEATNAELAAVIGRVVDWTTGAPLRGIQVALQSDALSGLTDAQGWFSIVGAAQGRQFVTVTLEEGIGTVDSVGVDWAGYGDAGTIPVSPRAPLSEHAWPGPAAAWLGNGWESDGAFHLPASGLPDEDQIWSFQIMPDGSIQRVRELGLGKAPTGAFPRSGDMAWHLPSISHLISFPEAGRILMAGSKTLGNRSVDLPFHPFGLVVEDAQVFAAGGYSDGQAGLATLSLPDLVLAKLDTLPGAWSGTSLPRNGPRMAQDATYRYVLASNSKAQAQLHRLPKAGGAVRTVALPFEDPAQLVARNGSIHVGCRSPATTSVLVFDRELKEQRPMLTSAPVERMRFGTGWASDLFFAATGKALLVFHTLSPKPVGRFALPAGSTPILIALKQEGRIVGVATETGFHSSVLKPSP